MIGERRKIGINMKALYIQKYGVPKTLELRDAQTPVPGDGEVLVQIKAASVNAADIEWMKGLFLVRFMGSPKNRILGSDMAGVVTAVGAGVSDFEPGAAVMADLYSLGMGTFGEAVCVPESALIRKPESLSFEQAATLPQAGILAMQALENAELCDGSEVLINGAGGGIGSFAMQIAKSRGAVVTGVDRADKFELLRRLGADECIDYRQQDYTKTGRQYDFILDLCADKRISEYRCALKADGRFVVGGGKYSVIFGAYIAGLSEKKSQKFGILMWRPNDRESAGALVRLIEEKKVTPAIDKVFALEEAAEAVRYCWGQNAKGKVVITAVE